MKFKKSSINAMKTCLIFLTVIVTSQWVQAQVKIGGKLGLVSSNLTGVNMPLNFHSMPTIQAAIACEIPLRGRFSLQPELMYGRHGGNFYDYYSDILIDITTTGYLAVNNIEIPVLLKVNFGENKWKFKIVAGPSLGIALRTESLFTNDIETLLGSRRDVLRFTSRFVKEGYNLNVLGDNEVPTARTNFNAHLGVGVTHEFDRLSLVFDMRYMQGVTSLFPNSSQEIQADEKSWAYSRRFGFSVGAMFPLDGGY
jgi:Outer membrane protein beta-barrel domain